MKTIGNLLNKLEGIDSSKVAIISKERYISYRLFLDEINRLAMCLKELGCKKGNTVGILLPDSAFLIYSILAVGKVGGIFIGFNLKSTSREIKALIQKAKVNVVITEKALIHKISTDKNSLKILTIEEVQNRNLSDVDNQKLVFEEVKEEDILGILLTSGTTGISRGVYHAHKDFMIVGENCASAWDIREDDRLLSGVPLLSALSLSTVVMPALTRGACIVIPTDRKPESLLQSIETDKVSFISGTPTVFIKIIDFINQGNSYFDLSSLKKGTVAGAPIPKDLVKSVKEKVGCELYPHYGMTELFAITGVYPGGDSETVGKPFPGVSIRIVNQDLKECSWGNLGEIVCISPTKAKGFLDEFQPSLEEEWFHTGDVGMIDQNGNLKITGRLKNVIIRGGNNIYPEEIEAILSSHPKILKGGIIGIPDEVYGEKIVAFVVVKERKMLNEVEIKNFLKRQLPIFKIPQQIIFVSEIPTTESGKVYRQELEKMYYEEIGSH